MSLISFGEILIDFLGNDETPPSFTQYPGGAPANVAVAYATLGGTSSFVGKLSRDDFGRFLEKSLQHYRVNTDFCRYSDDAQTALAFVSLDENKERSFSFYRDRTADLLFRKSDFSNAAFASSNIFHFCSNTLVNNSIFESTLHGLSLAESSHCITSFDLNLRLALWKDEAPLVERVWQCIQHSEIVKMSREELDYIAVKSNINLETESVISRCFELGVKLILVSDGSNTLEWITKEYRGKIEPPTVMVRDTTAAGDAFVGATLYAINQYVEATHLKTKTESNELAKARFLRLIQDRDSLERIINFSVKCGALSVTRLGAFPSFAKENEIAF
ncbi:carbohydrate kinase family protein [Aliikangiella coralliicola]|uniref:Carbohydrate kinase n=1 Tax=Aliikangiella coralliicola TaxID=2592383 RepID=A0A545U8Y5_9GAMM|nr:carbohydrate kinase [Aliikangiella coralliicola]TQV85925.1 carbohydrate kinase [Aliikangiella coralliicola]